MATAPIRRMAPGNAASRAAPVPRGTPVKRAGPVKRDEQVGRAYTSVKANDRGGVYHETHTDHELMRTVFEEGQHPAYVKVAAGLTINMLEFNSLRLDVGITIPCLPQDVDEAYEVATQFVVDRLTEEEVNWLGRSTRTPKKGAR